MKDNGYNPLRWDCEESGCFNEKMRPKIEMFSDCFPGKINFGDVDAEVELAGNFLQLEWKTFKSNVPTGQRIKYERMTALPTHTAIIVVGDAETMEVSAYRLIVDGKIGKWKDSDIDGLKKVLKRWSGWALKNPKV